MFVDFSAVKIVHKFGEVTLNGDVKQVEYKIFAIFEQ